MKNLKYKELSNKDLTGIEGGSIIDTLKLIKYALERLSEEGIPIFTSNKS